MTSPRSIQGFPTGLKDRAHELACGRLFYLPAILLSHDWYLTCLTDYVTALEDTYVYITIDGNKYLE